MCAPISRRSTRTIRSGADRTSPSLPPAPAPQVRRGQACADEQVDMVVEPGSEVIPELAAYTLREAQVVEVNPDQVVPQMPAPHPPDGAKYDRDDKQGSGREGHGSARTASDGHNGGKPADHETMLIGSQRQPKAQTRPPRSLSQRKQHTGARGQRHELDAGVLGAVVDLRRSQEQQGCEEASSARNQAPAAPE